MSRIEFIVWKELTLFVTPNTVVLDMVKLLLRANNTNVADLRRNVVARLQHAIDEAAASRKATAEMCRLQVLSGQLTQNAADAYVDMTEVTIFLASVSTYDTAAN